MLLRPTSRATAPTLLRVRGPARTPVSAVCMHWVTVYMPHTDPQNVACLDGEELVERVVQRKTLFPDFQYGSHVVCNTTKSMHWENAN